MPPGDLPNQSEHEPDGEPRMTEPLFAAIDHAVDRGSRDVAGAEQPRQEHTSEGDHRTRPSESESPGAPPRLLGDGGPEPRGAGPPDSADGEPGMTEPLFAAIDHA